MNVTLGQTIQVRRPSVLRFGCGPNIDRIALVTLDSPELLDAARADDWPKVLRLHDSRSAEAA